MVSSPRRSAPAAVAALLLGVGVFAAFALAVTAVLDPLVWPSLLVGLPVGALAGAAAAVLTYRYLARPADDAVNWRRVGVGVAAVLLVSALALSGLWVVGQQRADETYSSQYEYRVTLDANETLENATVYVPVPTNASGRSDPHALARRFVSDVTYSRAVPPVRGYDPNESAPADFSYRLVETDHGPMLAVHADRVPVTRVYYRTVENETMGYYQRIPASEYDPTNESMGVRDDGSFEFTVTATSNDPIDTADPFANEPLLSARYNRSDTDCPRGASDVHQCYSYDGRVYADYATNGTTHVYVGVELTGRNEWFSGGWTGNEYREWARVELAGPQDGWRHTIGELDVGDGRYRD